MMSSSADVSAVSPVQFVADIQSELNYSHDCEFGLRSNSVSNAKCARGLAGPRNDCQAVRMETVC